MDFKQIEAFVNVIKYKSFSKAADALFLTQPTISAHINSLEKELNVLLFNRKVKQVELTREGKKLYKYATDMINTREQAINSLRSYGNSMEGVLEIQASSIPGEYILPDLICEFSVKYPKVRYFLEQSYSKQVVDNLLRGKGEVGFVGNKRDKSLEYTFLAADKTVIITPRTEKFCALREDVDFETFINEPFVQREPGSATLNAFESELHKMSPSSRIKVIAKMDSMEAIKQAVAAGLGISAISEIAAEEKECQEKFCVFKPNNLHIRREFYMVCNNKISMSPIAAAFKDFVIKKFDIFNLEKNKAQ